MPELKVSSAKTLKLSNFICVCNVSRLNCIYIREKKKSRYLIYVFTAAFQYVFEFILPKSMNKCCMPNSIWKFLCYGKWNADSFCFPFKKERFRKSRWDVNIEHPNTHTNTYWTRRSWINIGLVEIIENFFLQLSLNKPISLRILFPFWPLYHTIPKIQT